jgi:signal transduction histidine kinase
MITQGRAAYDRLVTGSARGQALAARAAAWYAALPPKRREIVQDSMLALALAVLNLLAVLPNLSSMHPAWLAMFLAAVQCLPLAIRRVNPVLALILSGVPRNAYDALGFGYAPLPLANAIAFATVAQRSRPWLRWTTLGATAVGIAYGQTTPGHTEPYDAIVQYFIFGAAWVVGILARSQGEAFAAALRRAERAEAELDALAARAAEAATAERVRIARELHDVVSHHVSVMAVQAEAVGALLPARPEQASKSADLIATTARQAMTELRRLLRVLRGPSDSKDYSERSELSPSASLTRVDEVLAQVRGCGVPVSLTVSGSPQALSPSIDLTAYRIVQEALTNTIRHAPGADAHVDICYGQGSVTVQVSNTGPVPPGRPAPDGDEPAAASRDHAPAAASKDHAAAAAANGHASKRPARPPDPAASPLPDPATSRLGPGFGLAGIAERVSSCGGTLTVGPSESGGFAVTARLPVR